MLKFGSVTIDVSHPKTFAKILCAGDRARYTAVFNDGFRSKEDVCAYAETYGVKIYDDLDEMIDNVDLGLVHSCNWDKHLDYIMHFVRRGKPVFVDKPLVGNLRDCEKLLELSKNGARILGTSAMRFCLEVTEAKKKMAEKGCRPLHVTTTIGVDEFNYAIHGIEMISGLMECRPISCRYIGTAQVDGKGEKCETYYIKYKNGASATCHMAEKKYVLSNTIVMTNCEEPESDIVFIPAIETLYDGLLDGICKSVETGENALSTMEEMIDSIKVLLAGRVSRNRAGEEISIDCPCLYEVRFDGNEFERAYSAAAMKK